MVTSMRWDELRRERFSGDEIRQVDADAVRELAAPPDLDLRTLRESAGVSQVEVSERSGISQSEISKVERRDDHLVSTLRRYVEAVGGRLEVSAMFGETRIVLRDV